MRLVALCSFDGLLVRHGRAPVGPRDVGYPAGRTPQVTTARSRIGERLPAVQAMREDPISLPAAR
jgi:hypothetical protein